MSPGRAARHHWATERGRSVPRACGAAPLGYGNGAEMSPERVVMPRWATELGVSVARACAAAPLGDGNGRKCRPSVRRGTVGRRKRGRNVARACVVVLLGDGTEPKCSLSVRRGHIGRRKRAEMFPERAARPPWATELGGSVPRVCVVVLLGDGTGPKCSPSVKCGTIGRRKAAKPSPGRVWKRSRVAAFI